MTNSPISIQGQGGDRGLNRPLGPEDKAKPGYTCAMCHETFESEWSGEEAEAEYAELFPDAVASGEPREVVCDDCWVRLR